MKGEIIMSYDIPKNDMQADLVYKSIGERKLYLTFYPPVKKCYDKAPLVILITGGGWMCGSRSGIVEMFSDMLDSLKNKGLAIASIDYRVYAEENVFMQDIISDCFDGARYLSHFADVLGIDRNKIIAAGHSAGAHLALMLGYAPKDLFVKNSELSDDFKVSAIFAASAPTFMYEEGVGKTLNFDYENVFFDKSDIKERKKTSPIEYVSAKCPPTLLCAATSDRLVYPEASELLYGKLMENDVICEFHLSVGGGHCFEQINKSLNPDITLKDVYKIAENFILKYGI